MKLIIIVIYSLFISIAHSVDVESNLVINNSTFYSSINKLHSDELAKVDQKWIDYIKFYRTFYVEGENLGFYCKQSPKVYYKDRWQRDLVINSFVSTLQMILLEQTVPAIAKYSKELSLSSDEYEALYQNTMGESCSENMSVMSHRRITKLFKDSFKNNIYKLPSVETNPLFASKISVKQSREEKLVRELTYTIGLFQAACSWGQRYESLRLLSPLLKNEVIASYVIRQMSSFKIKKNKGEGLEMLEYDNSTTKVHCDGIICRKKSEKRFLIEFPKGIGSSSIYDDMKAIYCQEIVNHSSEEEPEIDSQIKNLQAKYVGAEANRLKAQFIALITKTPDFNVWTESFETINSYLKMGMEFFWDKWAKQSLNQIVENLNYEEPLVLKVVDRNIFTNKFSFTPKVILDLNSGEFDEEISINGKIKFKFFINIPKNDLKWFFFQYRLDDSGKPDLVKSVDQRLRYYVDHSYSKFKDKLSEYIIKGDVSDIIMSELRAQMLYFRNIDMSHVDGRIYRVPVEINVSPFALIYLKNKNLMKYYLDREISREKDFELENRIDSMAEKSKK